MEELRPGRASDSTPLTAAGHAEIDLAAAARAIEAFLQALGHPVDSDLQLKDTGRLVAAAFHDELLAGYRVNPAELLHDSIAASSTDLLVVRAVATTCICPHHLLPASGWVHIGYVPNGKIVGLGALSRLVNCWARRLILQETLCEEIALALETHLGASAAGCIAEFAPMCLTARGERPHQARVTTVATRGRLQTEPQLRREFFDFARVGEAAP